MNMLLLGLVWWFDGWDHIMTYIWLKTHTYYSYNENLQFHYTLQVNHSQRLKDPPLQPWLSVQLDGKVLCAHCNCMAGLIDFSRPQRKRKQQVCSEAVITKQSRDVLAAPTAEEEERFYRCRCTFWWKLYHYESWASDRQKQDCVHYNVDNTSCSWCHRERDPRSGTKLCVVQLSCWSCHGLQLQSSYTHQPEQAIKIADPAYLLPAFVQSAYRINNMGVAVQSVDTVVDGFCCYCQRPVGGDMLQCKSNTPAFIASESA